MYTLSLIVYDCPHCGQKLSLPDEITAKVEQCERLIRGAVLAEREACAQLADKDASEYESKCWQEAEDAAREIAAAIRAQDNPH